jgi:hypothetical protein
MLATVSAQTGAQAGPTAKTPWGEPDLQGIWTYDYQIPLQRPAKYAGKELFTEAERADLDEQRSKRLARDYRAEKGTEADVAGAYNAVFNSIKHTGPRTSLIVDPPDGRIPATTPEAQQRVRTEREYRLALLQAASPCKEQQPSCRGGKYGPPSPRRTEAPPVYLTASVNRSDGPEDRSLGERCMATPFPEFANNNGLFRRIVQTPGGISIFHDSGQGQGWQRNIVMNGSPHLPAHIRQWWGDSRGRWEGDTLVIDVTNFSPQRDFQGSRENLHLIERFTRTGPTTLEYVVTIEDPSTWTKPWTVKQEFSKQSDGPNRIYYEPRCHEGNYGMPALLAGARAMEVAFAEGRGTDPATQCTSGCSYGPDEETMDLLN